MIGNDIIDLDLARKESGWNRKRFLDKIFTEPEQQWIYKSDDLFTSIWILWSMKESAYKIFNRMTAIRAFNPIKFKCSIMKQHHNHSYGIVMFEERSYFTKSEISKEFINTIASQEEKELDRIIELHNTEYYKNAKLPFVEVNGVVVPASVSHHGRYQKVICIN